MKTKRLYGGWLAIPLTVACALAGSLSWWALPLVLLAGATLDVTTR